MQGNFHQYKLIRDLAKKYSHTTYLASPTKEPEHQVVLIVFTSSLFSFPNERNAVLQKAQHVKKLQHPHLMPILDMGIEDGKPFVVREYLPNGSLRDDLKHLLPQRLELRDALTIVLQIGEALAYAHTHNILHGNLKPENILLDAYGQALLTDFTLISRADAMIRDQATEEYAFCYHAPEQFAGTWDAYSDQYALGCLTYELLTGQVPFATQTLASMIGAYSYRQPVPLSEKVPNLPPSLDAAILKALAKEPDERFVDCSLFLEVIRSVLSPPPAFPLPRSATSGKQRPPSRPAHLPNAHAILASSHEPATSPNPIHEASSTVSTTESNRAEHMDISAIADVAIPEQAEIASTSETLEPATEDDFFSSLLAQDTSSKIDNYILKHPLHISKNNTSHTSGYEAMTQSELSNPDTLQIAARDADGLFLTKPFGEQESGAQPLSVFTGFIDEQDGLKIDNTALLFPKGIDTDAALTRRTRRGRSKFLRLVLLCFVIAISAIATSGNFSGFLAVRIDNPDEPINLTQRTTQAVSPAITSLAGTQPAVSIPSRATVQSYYLTTQTTHNPTDAYLTTQTDAYLTTQTDAYPTTQTDAYPTTQTDAYLTTRTDAYPTTRTDAYPRGAPDENN